MTPEWRAVFTAGPDGVRLRVKITPGSSRTRVLGLHGDRLKIAVAAPPEKGKANRMLEEHLGRILGLGRAGVRVVAGETSPQKTVQLEAAADRLDELCDLLQQAAED